MRCSQGRNWVQIPAVTSATDAIDDERGGSERLMVLAECWRSPGVQALVLQTVDALQVVALAFVLSWGCFR